ncbi:hypothetical protein MNBD_NITROSPINAE01-92 [hydrothermal vent metagenome]|uniref:PTS EIIA type-4 domain-containing protein n=1 Tax=hydrothermal vent metagenome TaxID=652676 RepID=A0A3B1CAI5_9ZZZZ
MNTQEAGRAGYLLIAHGALAYELVNTLEFIAGAKSNVHALAIDHVLDVDKARDSVMEAIDDLMTEHGVIIMTDLFGGAPSNIALSMLDDKNIEIVAGVNLPMMIHAVSLDEDVPLHERAEQLREYGKNNIFVASDVLNKRRNSGETGK